MLMLECLEVLERIFSARNSLAVFTYLHLLEAFEIIFLQFLVSFYRELNANYFGTKIRKIKPIIKLVGGLKVKVTLFLNDPVGSRFAAGKEGWNTVQIRSKLIENIESIQKTRGYYEII